MLLTKKNTILIFLSFLLFVSIIFYDTIFEYFILFIERFISSDQTVQRSGRGFDFLNTNFLHIILFLFSINILLYLPKDKYKNIMDSDLYSYKIILIKFIVIASLYFIYYAFMQKYKFLYNEDGVFEYATSLSFFIAALFFFFSLKYLKSYKILYVIGIVVIIISLFIALEEISYGQRIFSLTAPDYFTQYNYQKEINLHNFHPKGGEPSYTLVSYLLFGYYILSLILRYFSNSLYTKTLSFSHSDILVILFFSISSYFDAEATEFFIGLLICEISIRNYLVLKKKS